VPGGQRRRRVQLLRRGRQPDRLPSRRALHVGWLIERLQRHFERPVVQSVVMAGGEDGGTYLLTLHVRGLVEEKELQRLRRRVRRRLLIAGGTPAGDGWNICELDVSSPAQTYYLNNGSSNLFYCLEADYLATVQADTGATLTLTVNPVDSQEISNFDIGDNVTGIYGVSPYPETYDGQFVQLDLVAVTPGL
jgi:hypothetical protein